MFFLICQANLFRDPIGVAAHSLRSSIYDDSEFATSLLQ